MKTPREDPKDKQARLRERRTAELERSREVREQAQGMTGDIRRTFGNRVSIFGVSRPVQPRTQPNTSVGQRTIRMGERD